MKKLLSLWLWLCIAYALNAQTYQCGYDSVLSYQQRLTPSLSIAKQKQIDRIQQYRQNPIQWQTLTGNGPQDLQAAGCTKARFIIPVVVHVQNHPQINVTDTQVQQQIKILNEAFAPHYIQFCLAEKAPDGDDIPSSGSGIKGVTRGQDLTNYKLDSMILQFKIGNRYYDPKRYLNIYIVYDIRETDGSPGNKKGFNNSLPGAPFLDGIAVLYDWFGNSQTCGSCDTMNADARGTTLIHEVGHYLGLYHPYDGGCSAGADSLSCGLQGDFCCDTRPENNRSTNCPIVPPHKSCPTYFRQNLNDDRSNYMEASGEDCQDHFTPDQRDIMYAMLEGPRTELVSPENLNFQQPSCCVSAPWFKASSNLFCYPDTLKLNALSYSGATYRWIITKASNGTVVANVSTGTNSSFSWYTTDSGKFHITLRMVYGGSDSNEVKRSNYVTVTNCGSKIASEQGNWFFGDHAGIGFRQYVVTIDDRPAATKPNNIMSNEGTISQSDSIGNVLFYGGPYTDDIISLSEFHLFNSDYLPMLNGHLIGDFSARQGGIVVPYPGQSGKYYLFVNSGSADIASAFPSLLGLRYSVIDMSLDGGLGGIVSTLKDKPVKAVSGSQFNTLDSAVFCGEMITAIPHCNGADYWLLFVDNSDTSYANRGSILVYKISSTGIVHTSTSSIKVTNFLSTFCMKASPNGNLIAIGDKVLRFDRSTGLLSNYKRLNTSVFGLSFTSDSKFLYATKSAALSDVLQYDIESMDSIITGIGVGLAPGFTDVQLGPDNKVYIGNTYPDWSYINAINTPEKKASINNATIVGYEPDKVPLNNNGIGGFGAGSLPNFMDAKKPNKIPLDFFTVDSACGIVKFIPSNKCASTYLWKFGDGATSNLAEPLHTYSTKDSFTVTLTLNGTDSVKRKIKIGIDKSVIAGDTLICDTSQVYYYSVSNPVPYYTYTWSATNGTTSTAAIYYARQVKWADSGRLICTTYYDKNGCRSIDTLKIKKTLVTGNTISSNQTPCTGTVPSQLTGGGTTMTGTKSWIWQRKEEPGGAWGNITGATSQNYTPDTVRDLQIKYRRYVTNGACYSISNEVSITPRIRNNNISLLQNNYIRGCSYTANGTVPTLSSGSPTYQWQYSTDNTNWTNYSGATSQNLTTALNADSVYVRRRVIVSTCTTYSNVIKVVSKIRILYQIPAIFKCSRTNDTVNFTIKIENNVYTSIPVSVQGSIIDSGATEWSTLDTNSTLTFPTNTYSKTVTINTLSNNYVNFRILLHLPCGTLYSNLISNANCATNNYIDTIYGDTSLTEGDSAVFVAVEECSGFANMPGKYYKWYHSYNGGLGIGDFYKQTTSDTLVIYPVQKCANNMYVTVAGYNKCDTITGNNKSVRLNVTPINSGDLWLKDHVVDNGTQPTIDPNPWNSPDIWVRKSSSAYDTINENPDYKPNDSAKVYVRIRNRGSATTQPSELYVYWTKSSTGERWPFHWTASSGNGFLNNCNDSVLNQFIPYGKQINTYPISIPALAPGASTVLMTKWKVPNPKWYCRDTGSGPIMEDSAMFCLLARIQTCDLDSFGMNRREKDSLKYNVIWNNNIATKNLMVTNFSGTLKRGGPYWVNVTNTPGLNDPIRITLAVNDPDFWTYGRIYAVMDDTLKRAWNNGGNQGTGYTMESARRFRLSPITPFALNGIEIPDSMIFGQIGFIFEIRSDAPPITENKQWTFTMYHYQSNMSNADGGQNFVVNYNIGGSSKTSEETLGTGNIDNRNGISIYPNPAKNEVTVEGDQLKEIALYDVNGKLLLKKTGNNTRIVKLDIQSIAEGIVFIEVRCNDGTLHKEKVVIIH